MMRRFISGILVVVATAALAAQGTTSRYNRPAEKTINGTIKALASFAAPDGSVGVHFDLKTPDGMISVHVAPAMYLGMQNAFYMADEQIEIIGAPSTVDGHTTFWAKAIMKGSSMLVVRDAEGRPRWTSAEDGTDGCGVNHPPLPRATEF